MDNFFQPSSELPLKDSFLLCLYNYLIENGCSSSAQALLREAHLYGKESAPVESLSDWWDSFSMMRHSMQLSHDQKPHIRDRHDALSDNVGASVQGTFKVPINYRESAAVTRTNASREVHPSTPSWMPERRSSPLLVPGHAPLVVPKDAALTDRPKSASNSETSANLSQVRHKGKEPIGEHSFSQPQAVPVATPHELNNRPMQPPMNSAGGNVNDFTQRQPRLQQQKFSQQNISLENLSQMQQMQQMQQRPQHFQQEHHLRQQEVQRNSFDPSHAQHPQQLQFPFAMNMPHFENTLKSKNARVEMMENKKSGANARERPKPQPIMINGNTGANGGVMSFEHKAVGPQNGMIDTNISMGDLGFESAPRERAPNPEAESQNHAGMMAPDSFGGSGMDTGLLDGSHGSVGNTYSGGMNVMNLGFDTEGSDLFLETPLALNF